MLKNRNINLMYAIACLQGMVFYGPVATLYRQAAGVTVFQITLIESICLVIAVACELPWGILADRIGYRRTMVICCGVYFLSKIVFWRADGFGGFLAERVMLGVVIAGLSGVDTSVLYLSCESSESQKVFGMYNSLNMVGLLVAAGVYAVLIGENYRLAAFLTMISYGVAAVLALGLGEVRRPERKNTGQVREFLDLLRQLIHNKKMLILVVAAALFGETNQTITVFLNQLQYSRAGMTAGAIGLVYIAMTLLSLTGGWSSRITRQFGARRTGASLFLCSAAACLVLAVTGNAVLSVTAVLALRVSSSLFQPLQLQLQNQKIATKNRATALSLNAVLMDAVAIFTNLVFGRTAEISLALAMMFGCGLCVVGMGLYIKTFHEYRQKLSNNLLKSSKDSSGNCIIYRLHYMLKE